MRSLCLTFTFFLSFMQSAKAQECYQTNETCYLDYSKNEVCTLECYKLPHICLLNVPRNALSHKIMPAIVDHFNITRLDIVGNISSIRDTLEPPLDTFQILNITGSDLSMLFMSNTTAATLTISNTKIRRLTLRRQGNLKTIRITRNELIDFTNLNLANLPKAELLDLSINKIVRFGGTYGININAPDLVLNPNMRQLNLSYNQLIYVNSESFRSMPQLKILDLSHNIIEDLTAEPFYMKSSLTELYLSYNLINLLSINTFADLLSLKVLYLDHNNLPFLRDGVFLDLQNLTLLDISFNHLYSVKPEALLPLLKLTRLNLEGNLLMEIDFKIVTSDLNSITFFNIKDNPLICKNLQGQLIPNSVFKFSQGNCLNNSNYYGICCSEDVPIEDTKAEFLFEDPTRNIWKDILGDAHQLFSIIFGTVGTVALIIGIGYVIVVIYKIYKRNKVCFQWVPRIRAGFEEDAV